MQQFRNLPPDMNVKYCEMENDSDHRCDDDCDMDYLERHPFFEIIDGHPYIINVVVA